MPNMRKREPGEKVSALTIRLKLETYEEVRKYAYEQNMSQTLAMEELIAKGLSTLRRAKKAS